ncbi:unnamed protein product [Caenorhabditis auriculariae]|uniref:Polyprotein allergen nematode domain-containing protein n=1 Tax=Caenorhabditis auriculariae TaxID=2777116 RepID=A0A8S1HM44_9PELO|nr:unnamed protein product [Caenorhabditis auriculariae]
MRKLTLVLLCAAYVAANVLSRHDTDHHRYRRDSGDLHGWLTEEQKTVLKKLDIKSQEFVDKVMEYYGELPKDQKEKWDKIYTKECMDWVKDAASEADYKELTDLYAAKKFEKAEEKLDEHTNRLENGQKKQQVLNWDAPCKKLLRGETRFRREIDQNFAEFASWMTEDQRKKVDELKAAGKGFEDIHEETKKYFQELPEARQSELRTEFKQKCKAYFAPMLTLEEKEKIKTSLSAGEKNAAKDIISEVVSRQEGDKKVLAGKMQKLCEQIYEEEKRMRRDLGEKISKHLGWLSEEQKAEVKAMADRGETKEQIRAHLFKIIEEYEKNPVKKEELKLKIKQCYLWMERVASKEEIEALHKMHETDHDGCKKRVREYIKRLPVEDQKVVEDNLPYCEKLWYGSHDHSSHGSHDHVGHDHHGHHHRRRRHLSVIDKYLDWMDDSKRAELKTLEESGSDFDIVIEKIREQFKKLPEDKQKELKENFKNRCVTWAKEVAKPGEWDELKKLHAQNDHENLREKLFALEFRLTENQKHTIEHVRDICYTLWDIKLPSRAVQVTNKDELVSRRRREYLATEKYEKLKEFIGWLEPEQQESIKKLIVDGNTKDVYKEIISYFDETEGENRAEAKKSLQNACKFYAGKILGEENAKAMVALKESGASRDEMINKANEILNGINDAEHKEKAQNLIYGCRKAFEASRRRREESSLDMALKEFLTWLTPDQVQSLKELKEAGKKDVIYKKIMGYYDETTGDIRTKAKEGLQNACKFYGKKTLGEENVAAIGELKKSGASAAEMNEKVDDIVAKIEDPEKKAKAKTIVDGCKIVYAPVRRRREEMSLDTAIKEFLTWLTPEQVQKLRELEAEGKKGEVQKQVMAYFDETEGEVRAKAKEELKTGCKFFGVKVLGEANVKALSELKASGATHEEMKAKAEKIVEEIDDVERKKKAQKIVEGCAKFYAPEKRHRREEMSLDTAIKEFLTWLTPEQVQKLRELEAEGKKGEVQKQVMAYFDETEGEVRAKAKEELKTGCKFFGVKVLGEANVKALSELKASGATHEEMKAKAEKIVEEIDDVERKKKAQKIVEGCAKFYAPEKRHRREESRYQVAKKEFLTWLTADQLQKLDEIDEKGNKDEIYNQILAFYKEASGDVKQTAKENLQNACKHFGKKLLGEEKSKTLSDLKASGATNEEMYSKAKELADSIEDPKNKKGAQKLVEGCRVVYEPTKRLRRHHHHLTLETALDKYLTWLTPEQVQSLKDLKTENKKEEIYKKIIEYFDQAEGGVKETARTELQSACRSYFTHILGEEKAKELKDLKESGATDEEMGQKVKEMVDAIEDSEKKEKANRLFVGCKKVYAPKRLRRELSFYDQF